MNQGSSADRAHAPGPELAFEHELVTTLFDLGRQVAAVLDEDELLQQIPRLIRRLISFEAFAVYLLDERRGELRVAYSVGYPPGEGPRRLVLGQGLVGTAVASGQPLLVNDLTADPRYVEFVPGMNSEIVVPLLHKSKSIGALNILSHNRDQFTGRDVSIVSQFGAYVAIALVNARLYEQSRLDAQAFETLAEIGRDVASILDLDELLTRIAQLTKHLIDYRTFGLFLLNDQSELEIRVAVKYGEKVHVPRIRLGEGLVGYAALHKEPVLVPDVSQDPRYIKIVDDVRSELAIPLMLKDRCIGVIDLESPGADAFSKRDVEILTLLASQAAVAIENASLYEEVRATQERLEKEVRFAQRVQLALLPAGPPKRLKGIEVAAAFDPARELGGDFHDYLSPESNTLVVTVGDVSGKGVPAALYSAFAAELVRGRTFRRRYLPDRSSPAGVLSSVNTILHQRQLEEYYCTLCYAVFDLKRHVLSIANSGLPYPIRWSKGECAQIELPGVPLGSFPGSTYDEVSLALHAGDVFVFCSDGVFEAMNEAGQEFTAERLMAVVERTAAQPAAKIIEAIVAAVDEWRAGAPPNDDMTAVAVRITA
ncbi:MAG TPA: GAF domain-containing SpoIIE family protein phosphatase [Vicinamibacterales bacterium]|nr:GAF domain-containing SpoIIE family protein phosphatase [Vicinamibacterales bacterium]